MQCIDRCLPKILGTIKAFRVAARTNCLQICHVEWTDPQLLIRLEKWFESFGMFFWIENQESCMQWTIIKKYILKNFQELKNVFFTKSLNSIVFAKMLFENFPKSLMPTLVSGTLEYIHPFSFRPWIVSYLE